MTEPVLNCSRVVPFVGKRIAAGVAKHVHVNVEREAGALADALDQPINRIGGEWGAALSYEDVAAAGLALELAQGAQFVASNWVCCWLAVLHAPNVEGGCAIEFDLRPFQIANFGGA